MAMVVSTEQYFLTHIDKQDGGCWLWNGDIAAHNGYGRIRLDNKNTPGGVPVRRAVHCWSYERYVGPIPAGYQVDHLCNVRHCVAPTHLEAVTPRENNARSASPSSINKRRTHCVHGHILSGTNLYVTRDGKRQCRECRAVNSANYDARTGRRRRVA